MHVDPHRVGVLGFSAGGHLVAAISNHFERRLYAAVDHADDETCRPDFAAAIFPGHLSLAAAEWDAKQGTKPFVIKGAQGKSTQDANLAINPDLHVTSRTPPTFLLQAEDDPVDSVYNSVAYFIALKEAGVAAELHVYAHGGHAFGLRPTKMPITEWPRLMERWLKTLGMVA
jgi:acetyl esterase/lipase